MTRFATDLTPIAVALAIVAGVYVLHGLSRRGDESVVGIWNSYSLSTYGAKTAEFRADGTCRFRDSGGKEYPCKWTQLERKLVQVVVDEPGKRDVFVAGRIDDRLFVREPGRETDFVRVDSWPAQALR